METINSLKTSREFFLSFAKVWFRKENYEIRTKIFQDPQLFINKWLQSQTRDIKTMTDVTGNPEEERRVDYYYQPWVTEGVCRCSFGKRKQCLVNLMLGFPGTSMERFSKSERNWIRAWGCAILRKGKESECERFFLDLVGLLFWILRKGKESWMWKVLLGLVEPAALLCIF